MRKIGSQAGTRAEAISQAEALLRAEAIVVAAGRPPFGLELGRGAIVGLAGLEGHGQEAFLETLAGLRRPLSGRLVVRGRSGEQLNVADQHDATRAGIAYLPRDRKYEGIFPAMTVLDNFAIAALERFGRLGILRRRALNEAFSAARERLGIVVGSERDLITSLSGGNQQKVMLARALALQPSILLLNDPTRGVDANAKVSFNRIFRRLAEDDGMAIVVLSTELRELVELCDRVLVFYDGALNRICEKAVLDEVNLLAGMFGEYVETGGIS
jgi:ribose transport system ATP-binding protein